MADEEKPRASCQGCRFFAALAKECRKGPPTLVPLMVAPGQMKFVGAWPPTQDSNWCGAFEAAPVGG